MWTVLPGKKATAKNCYSKKEGLFLPQFGSLWEPSFKEEYKSSLTYTLYDDKTLWNDTVKNSHYAHEIFNYLTGSCSCRIHSIHLGSAGIPMS